MNAALPTGRRGQVIAVTLTLLVVALIWIAIVNPMTGWYDRRAETLRQRRELLSREVELVGTLANLQKIAREAANRPLPLAVLSGDTDAYASASLQGLMQDMASKSGATLTSIGTLSGVPVGDYQRIGLRVAMTATWPVFIQFLHGVEAATPQMLVDDISLHSSVMTLASSADLPVQASFTVVAFRSRLPTEARK
jgi:general secretion pathway protein M